MLNEMGREDIETKAGVGLGKFDSVKHNGGKSRPLKVVLQKKKCGDSIMRNRFKVALANDQSPKQIKISYDLSQEERNSVNETIEEAKFKSNESDQFSGKSGDPRGPYSW